jgi:hypothetical protein
MKDRRQLSKVSLTSPSLTTPPCPVNPPRARGLQVTVPLARMHSSSAAVLHVKELYTSFKSQSIRINACLPGTVGLPKQPAPPQHRRSKTSSEGRRSLPGPLTNSGRVTIKSSSVIRMFSVCNTLNYNINFLYTSPDNTGPVYLMKGFL